MYTQPHTLSLSLSVMHPCRHIITPTTTKPHKTHTHTHPPFLYLSLIHMLTHRGRQWEYEWWLQLVSIHYRGLAADRWAGWYMRRALSALTDSPHRLIQWLAALTAPNHLPQPYTHAHARTNTIFTSTKKREFLKMQLLFNIISLSEFHIDGIWGRNMRWVLSVHHTGLITHYFL